MTNRLMNVDKPPDRDLLRSFSGLYNRISDGDNIMSEQHREPSNGHNFFKHKHFSMKLGPNQCLVHLHNQGTTLLLLNLLFICKKKYDL